MSRWFAFYTEVLLQGVPEGDYASALEQLADSLPLEIAAVDRTGRVLIWNRALASTTVPREQAVGHPLLDVFPGLRDDANLDWEWALARVLSDGIGLDVPRRPLHDRVVRLLLFPLVGPDGGIRGAALALDDITERVRAEDRRILRVRSDAVEALGAGIAHEIRNPLNALSLNLQLLRERLVDPKTDRAVLLAKADTMIAEMRRVDDLVVHLLEVSRGGPPTRVPVHLDEVVGAVVERLSSKAAVAGIQLVHRRGSSRLLGLDPQRIDRAVHNLVRNAIEAVPQGGHVWVTTRDDPHSTVVVVDDDGPGIPPGDRSRIFELFFSRKRGGTGLGLPLARRAVEDHGGEIELLERPGGGTRFVVHLPIVPDASPQGGGREVAGDD